MVADFPYMNAVGNVPAILTRIQEAGAPPRFTHEFLRSSLGFSSSNDRGIIAVLKYMGFLTADGAPTDRYHEFRGGERGRRALADGLREGWDELFLADQRAHEKSAAQLRELFKSVTGKSESVSRKMATTFKAFADSADWSGTESPQGPQEPDTNAARGPDIPQSLEKPLHRDGERGAGEEHLSLHHDVHVHLPATSDVAVYRAIFRALREELI